MQRIDVLIVGALVLAAAGSALGVVTYDDDRVGDFTVAWTLVTDELEATGDGIAGPGVIETTLNVTSPNATSILFDVTLGGAAVRLQPTAILVEVVSPANDTTSAEGELPVGPTASVTIPVEVPLAPVPTETVVRGASLEGARLALNATLSSTLGIGTWTVRATFASTTPDALAESYTLAVVATVERYVGEVAIIGPEVGR